MSDYKKDELGREIKNPLSEKMKMEIKQAMFRRHMRNLHVYIYATFIISALISWFYVSSLSLSIIYILGATLVTILAKVIDAKVKISIAHPIIVNMFERQELYTQNYELPKFLKYGAIFLDDYSPAE